MNSFVAATSAQVIADFLPIAAAGATISAHDTTRTGQSVMRCPMLILFGLAASPGFFATSAFQPPATWLRAAIPDRVSPRLTM